MKTGWLRVLAGMAVSGLLIGNGYAGTTIPPTADANGSYAGNEGSSIPLDGSGSSGSGLIYDWDFGDGDSATDAGNAPTHTYADNGSYTVSLTVTDVAGESSTAQSLAEIFNVAPTVDPISDSFIPSGAVLDLLVTFSDPGIFDNPWSFLFDWGDSSSTTSGTVASISPISVSHIYTGSVGTMFNGSVSITDKDGGLFTRPFLTTLIASQVPEPTTLALLSLGLVGLGIARHKKKT